MTAVTTGSRRASTLPEPAAASHRADIDGLRALAILLVVSYHVWFDRVSGGVDVFLMISAYFLTGSLARRLVAGAPLELGQYWSRRFVRLLPAAAVVLVAVLAAVWLWYPASAWTGVWTQTWSSLFYVQNAELAASAVDYYARDAASLSPLQHFWSLSVQGQVFVLWPVAMLLAGGLARRRGWDVRRTLLVLFAGIFTLSFVYSVFHTRAAQESAYFDTAARLWEFALGSLLALVAPRIRLRAWAAVVVGWIGIAGLVLCGVLVDVQGGFPGYLALLPTLSAAAVIIAGQTASRAAPAAFLASRPLLRLGGIAYALYLVHWPILITWLIVSGEPRAGLMSGAGVIALSLLAAVVLTALVERPIQRSAWIGARTRRRMLALAVSAAVVAVPLAVWQTSETVRAAALESSSANPGAVVLLPGGSGVGGDYETTLPLPTTLGDEWVALDGACTGELAPATAVVRESCLEQRADGDRRGTLVVVGDSHAQQWSGAMLPLARDRGFDVVALLKGGCSFAADEPYGANIEGCDEWRDEAMAHIARLQPDVVAVMGTRSRADGADEYVPRGLERTIADVRETGAEVIVMRDNPRFSFNMFDCAQEAADPAEECALSASDVLADTNPAASLAGDGVRVIDLTDYLCPDGVCLPVIGGVSVYLDDNHLTGTFARTLAGALDRAL